MKAAFLIGRIVFGGFFLYNGINHFKQRKMMAQYAASKGIPLPEASVIGTGIALLFGGASIMTGSVPKAGAAAIGGFLATVSPLMHDFWNVQDPGQRMNETINFSKNMALLGGALVLAGVEEPWPAAIPVTRPDTVERVRRFARRLAA